MKNYAAHPEIWFFTKSILKAHGRVVDMPAAWELMKVTQKKSIFRWNLSLVGFYENHD